MKRLIVLSAIALLAVSASAQTGASSNGHGKTVSTHTRETTLKGKEKGESVRDLAKANRGDEMDNDIKFTKEEKDARKAARKANRGNEMDNEIKLTKEEKDARKAERKADHTNNGTDDRFGDLDNDGTLSPQEKEARKQARKADAEGGKGGRHGEDRAENGNNEHGKRVSGIARGTDMEGREKGAAVSSAAGSKARSPERVKANGSAKPRISAKPAGLSRGKSGKIK